MSQSGPVPPKDLLPVELSAVDVAYLRSGATAGLSVSGVLAPRRQFTLKAKVAGELLSLAAEEGDALPASAVVARIDTAEARAVVAERRALLASAEAELVAATRHRDAQRNLLDAGFVAPTVYDVADAAYLARQSAKLAAAAQLSLAETALAHAEIRTPSAGVIARRHANAGEYVAVGAPIVTLMDPGALQVVVSIPATEVSRVAIGSDCRLRVVGDEQDIRGRVARISPAPEGASRSYAVYVDVDNRAGNLRIGMFARGELLTGQADSSHALPISALRREDGLDYVLTVEQGRVARRPVVVQSRDEALSRARVEASFDASVPVIVTPHENLRAGLPVTLAAKVR